MTTLLEFIARVSVLLYIITGIGLFFALRGMAEARRKKRVAAFAMEREAAQQSLRQAITGSIVFSVLIVAVFISTNILTPNLTEVALEPTQTPVVFVTPQASSTPSQLLYPTITPTVGVPPAEAGTPIPTPEAQGNGCQIIGATITSPEPGQNVSGQVPVEGEANVLNFAQYKFELNGTGTGGEWVVVATYVEAVPRGILGVWDSTSLPAGPYTLRLSVIDTNGTIITPCDIPLVIVKRDSGS